MGFDDLLITGFGVFVGYWVVANLLLDSRTPARAVDESEEAQAAAPVPEAPPASADPNAWHAVLQVSPEAGMEEIRRAYQAKRAQCEGGNGLEWLGEKYRAKAAAQLAQVDAAYRQALREKGFA